MEQLVLGGTNPAEVGVAVEDAQAQGLQPGRQLVLPVAAQDRVELVEAGIQPGFDRSGACHRRAQQPGFDPLWQAFQDAHSQTMLGIVHRQKEEATRAQRAGHGSQSGAIIGDMFQDTVADHEIKAPNHDRKGSAIRGEEQGAEEHEIGDALPGETLFTDRLWYPVPGTGLPYDSQTAVYDVVPETERLAQRVTTEWSGFELMESISSPSGVRYVPLKQ